MGIFWQLLSIPCLSAGKAVMVWTGCDLFSCWFLTIVLCWFYPYGMVVKVQWHYQVFLADGFWHDTVSGAEGVNESGYSLCMSRSGRSPVLRVGSLQTITGDYLCADWLFKGQVNGLILALPWNVMSKWSQKSQNSDTVASSVLCSLLFFPSCALLSSPYYPRTNFHKHCHPANLTPKGM